MLLQRRMNYCISCVQTVTCNTKCHRADAAMMVRPFDRALKVVYMTASTALYFHYYYSKRSRSSGNFSWYGVGRIL